MPTGRLEAFSDGVMAILITIMVLELKAPTGDDFAALVSGAGTSLLTYLLSFVYIGIYWNNHHHMLQATNRITGAALWANLHLLFWLSLLPFTTAWMDDTSVARTPVAVYGINLLGAAVGYLIMQRVIIHAQGADSRLRRAVGNDTKGKVSLVLYLTGVAAALMGSSDRRALVYTGVAMFVVVAIIWLVPDRRIERYLAGDPAT